jgi:uncharacterized protein YdeI (YjbR/CyaY-like superfamily)
MGTEPLRLATPVAWCAWLEKNHTLEREVWLLHRKKGSTQPLLTLEEAIEEALCFGWVDSTLCPVDEETYALRYTPRRAGSTWAVSNVRRVEKLIAQGRMTEAGLAAVREAQASGAWKAALRREDPTWLPDELRVALDADELLRQSWERLAPSHRKQYIWWITSAKKAETLQRRIAETLRRIQGS